MYEASQAVDVLGVQRKYAQCNRASYVSGEETSH